MLGRRKCDAINGCGKFYNQHLTACPHCKTPDAFSDFIPYNILDWIYDVECYPNIFLVSFKHVATGKKIVFEISQWRNDLENLIDFLYTLKELKHRLIGFSNVGYDYPLLHWIIENCTYITYVEIFKKSSELISTPWLKRFDNRIATWKEYITQIDLMLVHHFDNKTKRVSLKELEFNMRSESVEDLPFEPGTILTFNQRGILIKYNIHDINETESFYFHTLEMIEFRELLSERYDANYLNFNDVKIGKQYIINEIEKVAPGSCYEWIDGRKRPRQTRRDSINLGDVIFPYIKFTRPEFIKIQNWLGQQTITNAQEFGNEEEEEEEEDEYIKTKGVFKDLSVEVDGFKFVFGLGGIHGSVDSQVVEADEEYTIIDVDVASYYPNIAIKNRLHPAHLGEMFCDIYNNTYEERKQHAKGSVLNAALKLALNGGGFGGAGDKYCPIYDAQYMLSITINGQLLLCLLSQYLLEIPNLKIIQINTDGVTVKCPRSHVEIMNAICKWWEDYTCLTLEHVNYKRMFIRDVNNYIAENEKGKLKRKGAYGYLTPLEDPGTQEKPWHKNHSALVVAKAAEAALVHGQCIDDFIYKHENIYDFMLRTKIKKSDKLYLGNIEQQKTTRYYVAKSGSSLIKISPPTKGYQVGQWKRKSKLTDQYYHSVIEELRSTMLAKPQSVQIEVDSTGLPWDERINTKNKSKFKTRETNLESGWHVETCNRVDQFDRNNVNFQYYIEEANKLVKPLRGNMCR